MIFIGKAYMLSYPIEVAPTLQRQVIATIFLKESTVTLLAFTSRSHVRLFQSEKRPLAYCFRHTCQKTNTPLIRLQLAAKESNSMSVGAMISSLDSKSLKMLELLDLARLSNTEPVSSKPEVRIPFIEFM